MQNRKSLRILPRLRRLFEQDRLESIECTDERRDTAPTPYLARFLPGPATYCLAAARHQPHESPRQGICVIVARSQPPNRRCSRGGAAALEHPHESCMPQRVPYAGPLSGKPAYFMPVSSAADLAAPRARTTPPRSPRAWVRRGITGLALAALITGCTRDGGHWQLIDVSGHLPDLAFTLTGDTGQRETAATFRGNTTLVYFGYTHCPDVCPETMARLMQVLEKLPADDAKQVRILFVSVDPARDTPQALRAYVAAFDAQHIRGLTGTDAQVESLAKRYRVAYQMEKRDPNGSYEVTHSSAVYIFDRNGRARLLATSGASPNAIAHDLQRVIEQDA